MPLSQVSVRTTKKGLNFVAEAVHPIYHNFLQESINFVVQAFRF